MLLALMDGAGEVLQWIDDYGADKVFMVFFFILYLSARRKLDKTNEGRLKDAKMSIAALIEAKHVLEAVEENLDHMTENQEHMLRKLEKIKVKLEKWDD